MQVNYPLISYVTATVGTLIGLIISGLLIVRKKKVPGTWYLVGWILTLGCSIEIVGAIIIALRDPKLALFFYQLSLLMGISCVFLYRFIEIYFKLKKVRIISLLVYLYFLAVVVLVLFFRESLIVGVEWNSEVNYYKAIFGQGMLYAGYFGMFLWLLIITRLVLVYRKLTSIIERNRLKYLLLGILFPLLGVILLTFPIKAIGQYPSDMWGTAIGTMLMAYGILKYKLMDISVIISRSLVYAIISSLIAGVNLIILFFFSQLLGIQTVNQPLIVTVLTALIIALLYQPVQQLIQGSIDRLFGYDYKKKQMVLDGFAREMASAININEIAESIHKTLREVFFIDRSLVATRVVNTDDYQLYGDNNLLKIEYLQRLENSVPKNEVVSFVADIQEVELNEVLVSQKIGLLLQLIAPSETYGYILLGSRSDGKLLSMYDLRTLETIANQSSVAIQNIYHFEREREVDKVKSEFINIASHNLRTPLTSIIGNLDLMKEKYTDSADEIDYTYASVQLLSNLAEQLITVSSLEGDTVVLHKDSCNIAVEIRQICDQLKLKAIEKKIGFSYDVPDIGFYLLDRIKIRMMLYGLIDNAIKFTDSGGVMVSLMDHPKEFIIKVDDSGLGIPEEEIPHLFEKFYQIHTRFAPMNGVGLGLYLSKLIVSAHEGRIYVSSKVGKGSTFIVNIPKVIP